PSMTVQTILVFATGASETPPIGFSPAPSIEFLRDDSHGYSTNMFPIANTCINCLKLPIITSYKHLFFSYHVAALFGF
uniref:HECT domain-containing protein n=1 Tax=Salarias fasciatus TaxID=181472 RepID=A0A672G425_SALFA